MMMKWSKTTKYMVILISLAAFIWLLYFIQPMVAPLIIAGLIAYVLNGLVGLLNRNTPLSHRSSVNLVYTIFLGILIAVPSVFGPILVRQIARLSNELVGVEQLLLIGLSQPIELFGNTITLNPPITDLEEVIRDSIQLIPGGALNLLSNVSTNLVWVLVILVTVYYLLIAGPTISTWIVSLAPPNYQTDIHRLLIRIDFIWNSFLLGQLLLMLVVGILTGISMAAVGLRGALAIAIIAGVLDIVPSLGPTIAAIISVVVAYFGGSTYLGISDFWFAVLVLGIFLLIQQIENIWLRPQIMGNTLQINPGLIFAGVLGALAITGILGAIVVIPLMATIKFIGRYVHKRLLDEDPWLDPLIEIAGEDEQLTAVEPEESVIVE